MLLVLLSLYRHANMYTSYNRITLRSRCNRIYFDETWSSLTLATKIQRKRKIYAHAHITFNFNFKYIKLLQDSSSSSSLFLHRHCRPIRFIAFSLSVRLHYLWISHRKIIYHALITIFIDLRTILSFFIHLFPIFFSTFYTFSLLSVILHF